MFASNNKIDKQHADLLNIRLIIIAVLNKQLGSFAVWVIVAMQH